MQALTHSAALDAGPPDLSPLVDDDWWRRAVGYEVYVRSFQDSNGDGTGDLVGITARLPYLASLGVDVVWLTPFFPSPGLDHGYDVADYLDVDPMLGTLGEWDELVTTAKSLGLRLFVDLVPNHTSSHHRWFTEACNDPTGPFRAYYIWADPTPDGGPPNNWVSHFGGPAWSLDPGGSGQYYCHLFLPEQPDLNWANPAVMDEFVAILKFWTDRGADGFRIDVAHGLTKDPALRDNPVLREPLSGMHPMEIFASFQHVHDLHRHETALLFRKWRSAVADSGAVLLGEMDTRDVNRFSEFVADRQGLHAGFVLQLGLLGWEPDAIIDMLLTYQQHSNGGAAWELSNHDQARGVSRYGGGEQGLRRTMALTTLMMALDGIVFLYQGEELGLPDSTLVGEAEDPITTRNGAGVWGRDVARGPMPWDSSPVNGFTTAEHAWLRTALVPADLTVAGELDDPNSTWHRYRSLTLLRKRFPALWTHPMRVIERTPSFLLLSRGDIIVAANLGSEPIAAPAGLLGDTLFASADGALQTEGAVLWLAGEATIVAAAPTR